MQPKYTALMKCTAAQSTAEPWAFAGPRPHSLLTPAPPALRALFMMCALNGHAALYHVHHVFTVSSPCLDIQLLPLVLQLPTVFSTVGSCAGPGAIGSAQSLAAVGCTASVQGRALSDAGAMMKSPNDPLLRMHPCLYRWHEFLQ